MTDAISQQRAVLPNSYFREIGELLAIPELSVGSPWINIADPYCLADADVESFASQLLARVRHDPIASLISSTHQPQIRFTLFPSYTYEVQSSADLPQPSHVHRRGENSKVPKVRIEKNAY